MTSWFPTSQAVVHDKPGSTGQDRNINRKRLATTGGLSVDYREIKARSLSTPHDDLHSPHRIQHWTDI